MLVFIYDVNLNILFTKYLIICRLLMLTKYKVVTTRTNEIKTNIHFGDIMMCKGNVVLNPNPSEKYIK